MVRIFKVKIFFHFRALISLSSCFYIVTLIFEIVHACKKPKVVKINSVQKLSIFSVSDTHMGMLSLKAFDLIVTSSAAIQKATPAR
jgi:hypothetical protein